MVARGWGQGVWEDEDKRYKLPVIRWISSEDLIFSMVTVVNLSVLYTLKFLRETILNVLTVK